MKPLNSGERILRGSAAGLANKRNKKVLNGIGFLVSFAARSFNGSSAFWNRYKKTVIINHQLQKP